MNEARVSPVGVIVESRGPYIGIEGDHLWLTEPSREAEEVGWDYVCTQSQCARSPLVLVIFLSIMSCLVALLLFTSV